ncbi:DUF6192 family protein [Streptomyces chartreusis]|uniref:DUF6192 family protein n=1 Tax=Streptomyces chartreusis TaxID=1969 RepID=UPI003634C130
MGLIHDRATDAAVVAAVTTDYPRHPAVASKAPADDTARQALDEAPHDRFRQSARFVHE